RRVLDVGESAETFLEGDAHSAYDSCRDREAALAQPGSQGGGRGDTGALTSGAAGRHDGAGQAFLDGFLAAAKARDQGHVCCRDFGHVMCPSLVSKFGERRTHGCLVDSWAARARLVGLDRARVWLDTRSVLPVGVGCDEQVVEVGEDERLAWPRVVEFADRCR